jgi:hypothetical protein
MARHQQVVSAAENEFQAAAIKLQGRLSKERNALVAKVQQFKAAIANAENAVARLKTKKSKPLIILNKVVKLFNPLLPDCPMS